MKHEEQPGTAGSEKELGWRLCLSWERKLKTKEERAVGSLIWMGRGVILFSFLVAAWVDISIFFPWLAAAMLLIYPLYVVIYRKAIRIRRPEVVVLMVIALALAALWIWVGVFTYLNPPTTFVRVVRTYEATGGIW